MLITSPQSLGLSHSRAVSPYRTVLLEVGLRVGSVRRLCGDCVVRVRKPRRQVTGSGHTARSAQKNLCTLTLGCLGRKG